MASGAATVVGLAAVRIIEAAALPTVRLVRLKAPDNVQTAVRALGRSIGISLVALQRALSIIRGLKEEDSATKPPFAIEHLNRGLSID